MTSTTDLLRRERAALCDTFARLGADAPTLCEGWTVADLAAHLVVRERRPDAGPGILLGDALGGVFGRHTQRLMDEQKARGLDAMLATLRSGPPALFTLGPIAAANLGENWIHHEDARRANGEGPRPADAEVAAVLWSSLAVTSRLAARRVPVGLTIATPTGERRVVRDAAPMVTAVGEAGELALFLSGRLYAAQVQLDGPSDAVERLRSAKLGI